MEKIVFYISIMVLFVACHNPTEEKEQPLNPQLKYWENLRLLGWRRDTLSPQSIQIKKYHKVQRGWNIDEKTIENINGNIVVGEIKWDVMTCLYPGMEKEIWEHPITSEKAFMMLDDKVFKIDELAKWQCCYDLLQTQAFLKKVKRESSNFIQANLEVYQVIRINRPNQSAIQKSYFLSEDKAFDRLFHELWSTIND